MTVFSLRCSAARPAIICEKNGPLQIVGGVCLILAAIAFQILPFSWVGLLVVLLGLGLMVAEIFVTSYGALFAAGLACLLLGGSMLFDMPEVSDLTVPFWSVLVPIVVAFGIIAGLVTGMGVTLIWQYTPALDALMYELVPAFFAALIVTVVVSLRTKPPENVDALFQSMKGET